VIWIGPVETWQNQYKRGVIQPNSVILTNKIIYRKLNKNKMGLLA